MAVAQRIRWIPDGDDTHFHCRRFEGRKGRTMQVVPDSDNPSFEVHVSVGHLVQLEFHRVGVQWSPYPSFQFYTIRFRKRYSRFSFLINVRCTWLLSTIEFSYILIKSSFFLNRLGHGTDILSTKLLLSIEDSLCENHRQLFSINNIRKFKNYKIYSYALTFPVTLMWVLPIDYFISKVHH